MKASLWIVVVLLAGVTAVCARLGLWQLDRLAGKRAANAAMAEGRARPPVVMADSIPLSDAVQARRVAITGRFDERVQILLRGRVRDGEPGVEVVTPFAFGTGDNAVLVDRGWLPASDDVRAKPQDYPEPEPQTLIGVAEPVGRGLAGPALRLLDAGPPALYSEQTLDLDTIATRLAYSLAPFVVRQLPGPGVPERPRRLEPEPLGEMMHVVYAAQWFLFAAGALAAAAFLLHRARRPANP